MDALKYVALAAAIALTACGDKGITAPRPPAPVAYETQAPPVTLTVETMRPCLAGDPPTPPPKAKKQKTLSATMAAVAEELERLRRFAAYAIRLLKSCQQ